MDETPPLLTQAGLDDLPVLAERLHMAKSMQVLCPENHTHGVPLQEVIRLPEYLADPILIMDAQRGDSLVLLLDGRDEWGRPLIASLHVQAEGFFLGEIMRSHFLTSFYGRHPMALRAEVQHYLSGDRILYANRHRLLRLFFSFSMSPPEGLNRVPSGRVIKKSQNAAFAKSTNEHHLRYQYLNQRGTNWYREHVETAGTSGEEAGHEVLGR